MDILIDATTDNAKRLLAALREFGFGSLNLSVEDFSSKGNIIQLGYEPVRIDFNFYQKIIVVGTAFTFSVSLNDSNQLDKIKKKCHIMYDFL